MQQGGSQYGVPPSEMTPTFAVSGTGPRPHMLRIPTSDQLQQPPAEAASPISSRPPAPAAGTQPSNIDELAPAMAAAGNHAEDADAIAAGEEAERGVAGNRWPRQETLALLKIRSDMDATFRDATLKGPLWDEVSRKLAELGYTRSAKKCKEKFENVHKYYKRTKEKCGGRQDGKSYRFFSQLEALNNSTSSATASLPSQTASAFGSGMAGRAQPTPLTSIAPSSSNQPPLPPATEPVAGVTPPGGLFSFSSNTSSSSSSSDSDGEDTEEGVATESGQHKRKRSGSGGGSRKMRNFFKGLMQQVLERQEAMQKKFLETIEKREQDRMIREEAWKRQEIAQLSREHELNAQERAMSATRDNSIIAFLQKITGQSIPVPQVPVSMTIVSPPQPAVTAPPPPPPPPPQQQHQQQQPPTLQHKQQQAPIPTPTRQRTETSTPCPPPPPPRTTTSSSEPVVTTAHDQTQEFGSAGGSTDPASSRWPKTEVHALIKIRSEMEPRYQEAGPKGPLWEEISAGMRRMGYNRNSKRCKEKWENINKYFKKVKESSKKRPEDSKTCPYFHQLDALYRKKVLGGAGSISGGNGQRGGQQESHEQINPEVLPITTLPPPTTNTQGGTSGDGNGGNSEACVASATNGGHSPTTFLEEGAGTSATGGDIKKPEDIVKELMERDYDNVEENGSDGIGVDDEDEDEEQQKMAYKIEFQRPNVGGTSNNGGNPSVPKKTTTTTTTAASSFLAMVK